MCGIAGALILSGRQADSDNLLHDVRRMTERMLHRGPDGFGVWADPTSTVALGHRRLAIVDLSEHGRQPMSFADGRFHITFNGEIYNFRELARDLEMRGHRFTSSGDTQVLLAAIAEWGPHAAVQRAAGMFAFALWDSSSRTLYLGRDRMGEKPLHYGVVNGRLYFASELKAFAAISGFSKSIGVDAIASYLKFGYLPEPLSMYEGIWKLPPGTTLAVPADASPTELGEPGRQANGARLQPVPYWSCREAATNGRAAGKLTDDDASAELERELRQTIRRQMACDVPIGCFLSGGVDSSLVASVMQAESSAPIHTFTVRFAEAEFDESEHARQIARHLGTLHEEFVLSQGEITASVPTSIASLDEPTANGSFFAVQQISRLARTRATVVLSGDGGDELFAGYNRYALTPKVWTVLRTVPTPLRAASQRLFSRASSLVPPAIESRVRGMLGIGSQSSPGAMLDKVERLVGAPTFRECYDAGIACWWSGWQRLTNGVPRQRAWSELDGLAAMLLSDQLDYLPGDNLAKVDRASMSVSLETRLPLLDHRIVELSWRVPEDMKFRDGKSKWLMRSVLDRLVPRQLTERTKMGFSVPIDGWLSGGLHAWANDMLGTERFRQTLGPAYQHAIAAWHSYRRKAGPSGSQIWALVILAAWLNESS